MENEQIEKILDGLKKKFPKSAEMVLEKAGRKFTYLETAAVIKRLNEVCGTHGWSFSIDEYKPGATVVVVRGSLFIGHLGTRSQFGECQVNKGMQHGDAAKGAASDCLKKCASLFGIGLYLSKGG